MQYISGEARKPSIFVSSTCYDLKQIRQDIREADGFAYVLEKL